MLAKYNAHSDPLFKQAAILKISDMLRINALKLYYKYQSKKLPNYFYNFNLTTQGSHHSYDTRSSKQIRTDKTGAEFCDSRIRILLPKIINSTPANLLQKFELTVFRASRPIKKGISWMNILKFVLWLIVTFVNAPEKNDVQPFSTGFLHAKLTSVSKCSITLSSCYCCILFYYGTICILLRHEDATFII